MPQPTANLSYGKQDEATIDHANIAMRGMPFYQDFMKGIGQDPGHPTLSKDQSKQLLKQAQANGFVIDEGQMEMDNHGNMNPKGHKLRNTLIVAGIAAATIATMGAAGVFAGTAGAATGAASGAAGTAAGLTGVEAGVAAGLGSAALPGAMATLPALAGTTAALGGTAATLGTATTGLTTMQKVAQAAKLANTARTLGSSISSATDAAGQNRLNQEEAALTANRDNIAGNKAAEDALANRSLMEGTERHSALIDIARASNARNPNISEFNTRGPKQYTPEYMSALTDLEQRGLSRLKADPTYSTDKMTPLKTYNPLDIKDLQGATNTKPGLMERIGQYAGPILSTYGAIAGKK